MRSRVQQKVAENCVNPYPQIQKPLPFHVPEAGRINEIHRLVGLFEDGQDWRFDRLNKPSLEDLIVELQGIFEVVEARITFDVALAAHISEDMDDLGNEFEDDWSHLSLRYSLIALLLLFSESLLDCVVVVLDGLVALLILVLTFA